MGPPPSHPTAGPRPVHWQAEDMYKSVLSTRQRTLGLDDLATVRVMCSLADLWTMTRRQHEAKPLYQQARTDAQCLHPAPLAFAPARAGSGALAPLCARVL